jgi:hypothetical protein
MQQPRFFFVSFPLPKLAQFRLPMLPVLRGEGADVERAPEAGAQIVSVGEKSGALL